MRCARLATAGRTQLDRRTLFISLVALERYDALARELRAMPPSQSRMLWQYQALAWRAEHGRIPSEAASDTPGSHEAPRRVAPTTPRPRAAPAGWDASTVRAGFDACEIQTGTLRGRLPVEGGLIDLRGEGLTGLQVACLDGAIDRTAFPASPRETHLYYALSSDGSQFSATLLNPNTNARALADGDPTAMLSECEVTGQDCSALRVAPASYRARRARMVELAREERYAELNDTMLALPDDDVTRFDGFQALLWRVDHGQPADAAGYMY
ncbi:MAG: hypothetical protein AB8I08_34365 [Sandaracinaceae bacterium]